MLDLEDKSGLRAARTAAQSVSEKVTEVLDRYAQTDGEDEWIEPEDGWRLLRDLRAVIAATVRPICGGCDGPPHEPGCVYAGRELPEPAGEGI